MRVDPRKRARAMGVLLDTLDAESEEGAEDAWRVEIERRIAERGSVQVQGVPGRS